MEPQRKVADIIVPRGIENKVAISKSSPSPTRGLSFTHVLVLVLGTSNFGFSREERDLGMNVLTTHSNGNPIHRNQTRRKIPFPP